MKHLKWMAPFWLRILFFLAVVVAARVSAAQAPDRSVLEQVAVYPTLIVHDAKIYTIDKNLSTYQAMAVRGDRIWRLGSNDEIRKLAGPQTIMVDAKGRAIVPGLNDSHTHPPLWGIMHHGFKYNRQMQYLYVEGRTLDEVKSRLGEAVAARIQREGPDKWVVAAIPDALSRQAIMQNGIDKQFLDRIAPNTPMAMVTGITGNGIINTKAKQRIDQVLGEEMGLETVAGLGMDPETLRLNTIRFHNVVAFEVILEGNWKLIADLIEEEMAELVPLGVTTIGTYIETPVVMRAVNYLDQQGRMPVRWGWTHRIGFILGKDPVEFYSLLGNIQGQGSDWFWNVGAGMEGWNNSCLPSPTPVNPEMRRNQEELRRLADAAGRCQTRPGTRGYEGHMAALRAGYRLANVHANNDTDLDAIFGMAEQLIKEGSATLQEIREPGWNFDHGTFINPAQASLAAKYGIWMDFQPRAIPDEDSILQNFGAEYMAWDSPAKAWLDAGARFVLNTDSHLTLGSTNEEQTQDRMLGGLWGNWPVEWRNSVWPWLGAWITREFNGKVYSPQNKLDRTTVMKAWTIWPAQMLLRDKDLGSLEPGKLADFVVTDKDYFTVPEKEIFKIKTLLTVIGGKIRYQDSSF